MFQAIHDGIYGSAGASFFFKFTGVKKISDYSGYNHEKIYIILTSSRFEVQKMFNTEQRCFRDSTFLTAVQH